MPVADDIDITIVDAPGFIDFFEETKQALAGVDAAIVVVEADPGRVVQTQALVDYLESMRMPHIFVVNKMDRPGADFAGTLAALQAAYGRHVVAEQLPIGSSESFGGYVDLAEMKAYRGDAEVEIPGELADDAHRMHVELLEAMADFDDHLMEELLEGVEPPLEEIERDLCSECSHDQVVPVLVASGMSGTGVAALVRAIEKWLPSPADAPQVDAEGRPIEPDPAGPVVARVIKTSIHPQSGKISIVRVLSGTIKSDATLSNVTKRDDKVRLGGLYRLQGKKQEPLPEATAGMIVALARLDTVSTGDTLTSQGHKVLLARVPVAEPGLCRRHQTEGTHRRSEDLADARAHRRRGSGTQARSRRRDARNAAARPRRATRRHRRRTARAQIQSRSRHRRADDSLSRNDLRRHRNPFALQTSNRRSRTVRRRLDALRAPRRAAPASPSKTRSSAASFRVSSSPRSKKACAKRWPTVRAAIR